MDVDLSKIRIIHPFVPMELVKKYGIKLLSQIITTVTDAETTNDNEYQNFNLQIHSNEFRTGMHCILIHEGYTLSVVQNYLNYLSEVTIHSTTNVQTQLLDSRTSKDVTYTNQNSIVHLSLSETAKKIFIKYPLPSFLFSGRSFSKAN